jgi:hypothetical protein
VDRARDGSPLRAILALEVSAPWTLPSRAAFAALPAILALLAGEGTARAAASARLFYGRAPAIEGCPDEGELRRAIAQRVGYDPIFLMAPNSVTVSIVREGGRLLADIKLANREGVLVGSRKLAAPALECGELTATIALTVAIALDTIDTLTPWEPPKAGPAPADATGPSTPTEPAAGPPPSPTAELSLPSEPRPQDAAPVQREPSSLHLELGLGMSGAPYGVAPTSAVAGIGFASLRWSRFEIGIEGWAGLPASASVGVFPDASVRTSLSGGGSTACLHFGPYFGCAVAFVGSLRAEAPGVPGASSGRALELLGGPRAGIDVPLGSGASLRFSGDVLADATRPSVRASRETLWQAPAIALAAQGALAFQIP